MREWAADEEMGEENQAKGMRWLEGEWSDLKWQESEWHGMRNKTPDDNNS